MNSKIPNILSVFRIISVPCLLLLAWNGHRKLFIALLIASLITDALDGYIARKYNLATALGSRLDSFGDMAIYLTVPLCAWWLWPAIIIREVVFVSITIGAYGIPIIAGLLKYGKIPSYHTYGAKAAAIIMSISALMLLTVDIAWPFRYAAIFQAVVACEEVLITVRLPALRSNVKSLWHLKYSKP